MKATTGLATLHNGKLGEAGETPSAGMMNKGIAGVRTAAVRTRKEGGLI